MNEALRGYISQLNIHPQGEDFASKLAKAIVRLANRDIIAECVIEFSVKCGQFKYKDAIDPISHILHAADISRNLHSLLFLMNQISRGEGDMDGEGLSIFIGCALDIGLSSEELGDMIEGLIA